MKKYIVTVEELEDNQTYVPGEVKEIPDEPSGPLTVSVAEAAEMLGISKPTLYQLIHSRGFPAFKCGGRTLISTDGLRDWVRKQTDRCG